MEVAETMSITFYLGLAMPLEMETLTETALKIMLMHVSTLQVWQSSMVVQTTMAMAFETEMMPVQTLLVWLHLQDVLTQMKMVLPTKTTAVQMLLA